MDDLENELMRQLKPQKEQFDNKETPAKKAGVIFL